MIGDVVIDDYVIEGPAVEPIDVEYAKKCIRFTSDSEDTLIDMYISQARQFFEEMTGTQLITALREQRVSGFPTVSVLPLRRWPVQEIVSVVADDISPEEVLVSTSYRLLQSVNGLGSIRLVSASTWPSGSGRIRYRAGFGDTPGSVPELIRGALGLLVGYFHQNRSEGFQVTGRQTGEVKQLPLGVKDIIRIYSAKSLSMSGPLRLSTWV